MAYFVEIPQREVEASLNPEFNPMLLKNTIQSHIPGIMWKEVEVIEEGNDGYHHEGDREVEVTG